LEYLIIYSFLLPLGNHTSPELIWFFPYSCIDIVFAYVSFVADINLIPCPALGDLFSLKKRMVRCCHNLNDDGWVDNNISLIALIFNVVCFYNQQYIYARMQNGHVVLCHEEKLRRRFLLFFSFSSGLLSTFPSYGKTKSKNPYDERRLLEQNKRIQKENNVPEDFPSFIREGPCLWKCDNFIFH
jgi:hypothetical protein